MPRRATQHSASFCEKTKAPQYPEISCALDLRDPQRVLAGLAALDWAFTDADTSFLGHDIHPYPAKYIPQIPGTLVAQLSLRGELILDPFGGSGTTALEAMRLCRRAISGDANPLAALIGRVKTAVPHRDAWAELDRLHSALLRRLARLPASPRIWIDRYAGFIPAIPNLDKWFAETARGELALIRAHIADLTVPIARDIASVALSRIVLKASFQDSETRYVAVPRKISPGQVIQLFVAALQQVAASIRAARRGRLAGAARFFTGDARYLDQPGLDLPDEAIDLVVTSPPYGNSNDYHLYHRFRMFWLGHDPRALGKIEIGSHLRHQHEGSGFESYVADMKQCLGQILRVLRPGRYAALVVGDSIYRGEAKNSSQALADVATAIGLESVGTIARPIHATKRSFVRAGQRASSEAIVLLRKKPRRLRAYLAPASYRMWPYEETLRLREAKAMLGLRGDRQPGRWQTRIDPYRARRARCLAFTHAVGLAAGPNEPTWQALLEGRGSRKNSKYATHGLHPYKGKFYPQLAKAIINISGVPPGAVVLDPFCGSGTAVLESYLSGMRARGLDLHPLAAHIAAAKIAILAVEPEIVRAAARRIDRDLDRDFDPGRPHADAAFGNAARDEIARWFPAPVVAKLSRLCRIIRNSAHEDEGEALRGFFEVILSSLIRDVSQQDVRDLRIRRRKNPIADADVIGLFRARLAAQMQRLEHYWAIRAHCPHALHCAGTVRGDARDLTALSAMGLGEDSVDLVLTSPPYAMALPYIDTDRLSLLVLFGMASSDRRPLEHRLCGSREISRTERAKLDAQIVAKAAGEPGSALYPDSVASFVAEIHRANTRQNVGFRRRDLPALLHRFFADMARVFGNLAFVLRPGGQAAFVIGDNYTVAGDERVRIPTTDFLVDIARAAGLRLRDRIAISVTTENMNHAKHAITKNTVLRFVR